MKHLQGAMEDVPPEGLRAARCVAPESAQRANSNRVYANHYGVNAGKTRSLARSRSVPFRRPTVLDGALELSN